MSKFTIPPARNGYALRLWLFGATLVACSANAQQPPIEFKGVPIGAPVADLLQRLPAANCRESGCTLHPKIEYNRCGADAACLRKIRQDNSFGGVLPDSYIVLLREGKVDWASIRFEESAFSRIAAGLVEKYGPPTKDVTERVQNRMGATFDDRRLHWDRTDGEITASQRSDSIDTSSVTMSSAARVEADRAAAARQPKATAKSL